MKDLGESILAECERALARSQAHGIVARILSDPKCAVDEALYLDLIRIASDHEDFAFLRKDLPQILDIVKEWNSKRRSVEQEYTRLFLKGEAPPYECSYVPASRITQELADISGFFHAFGLQPRHERQDHVVSQLEFMSFLCLKESIARGNERAEEADICRDAQAKFIRDHLGKWMGAYYRLLSERAAIPLYPLVVGLARKIVSLDASYLGIAPDEITHGPEREAEGIPGCGMAS